jgi:hypothetical protein
MPTVPKAITERIRDRPGEWLRGEPTEVLEDLALLRVAGDSQFGAFYLRYRASPLFSNRSHEELMDVASPSPQVRNVTTFVRDTHDVPEPFICITSADGEGFYLYDPRDKSVYGLGVKQLHALRNGSLKPRWPDFFTFLAWYPD